MRRFFSFGSNLALLSLCAGVFTVAPAQADVIIAAQSVLSSPAPIDGFNFDRTIDQSGLSVNYISGVTDFDAYAALNPIHIRNNSPENYAASFDSAPVNVDMDLGSPFTITRLAFWNYPFNNSAGVAAMTVFTSNTPDFASATNVGTLNPVNDGDENTNSLQVFTLTPSTARYARLRITATLSSATGYSEVAFGVGAAGQAAPEPGTFALLGAGLGVVGLVARRRNK